MDGTILFERMMRGLHNAMGARSHHVAYDGGTVHVLDVPGYGRLPPVVMLHGFTASGSSQYGGMIRRLRPHVSRIVVPDLPGHGDSSVPQGGLGGEVMLRGVCAALDRQLRRPAVMFASSMGGGIAVRYAAERPRALLGLMLCSPGGAPISEAELHHFTRIFRPRSHRDALAFVDLLFPHRHPLRQAYAWGVRRQFRRPHFARLIERVPEQAFLAPADLRNLQLPVYLLWGKQDRVLPTAHLRFFREHLRGDVELDTPAQWGHAPFLHHADKVSERLLRFAQRLAG
jgi:pimeloyl-ACP methyl ester carboxylesterase